MEEFDSRLRCPCSTEFPVEGKHRHECELCHTAWEHVDDIPMQTTKEEFDLAHTCPKCKALQYNIWPNTYDQLTPAFWEWFCRQAKEFVKVDAPASKE